MAFSAVASLCVSFSLASALSDTKKKKWIFIGKRTIFILNCLIYIVVFQDFWIKNPVRWSTIILWNRENQSYLTISPFFSRSLQSNFFFSHQTNIVQEIVVVVSFLSGECKQFGQDKCVCSFKSVQFTSFLYTSIPETLIYLDVSFLHIFINIICFTPYSSWQ